MPLNYDFAIAEAPGSDGLAHFRDPVTASALQAAPQAVQDFLADCGFGPGALDSGAPRGAYWSTEEGARLAIMERMSEALERYRLPKPGEVPEGGFNLSHLFAAMMSAEPVERPLAPLPGPARVPVVEAVEPPVGAGPGVAPGPGRVAAGLSTHGATSAATRSTAAAQSPSRPPRPAAPQDGPSVADLRAALTATDLPPADLPSAASARTTNPTPARTPRPGPGLEVEMDFPAARPRAAAAPAPAPPEAAPAPAATPAPASDPSAEAPDIPSRRTGGGAGRLLGILMLVVGLALVLYAILSLL